MVASRLDEFGTRPKSVRGRDARYYQVVANGSRVPPWAVPFDDDRGKNDEFTKVVSARQEGVRKLETDQRATVASKRHSAQLSCFRITCATRSLPPDRWITEGGYPRMVRTNCR